MLPASAGMILARLGVMGAACGAPRICGDDPLRLFMLHSVILCSPHLRG